MAKHAVDVGGCTTTKHYAEAHTDKARGHHKEVRQFMKSSKKNPTQGSRRTVEGILIWLI